MKTYPLAPKGFTLIELMVVVAIIAILSSIAVISLNDARIKGRDAARKVEISQVGRILTVACPIPTLGAGDYDMSQVAAPLIAQYPQYASYIGNIRDPRASGSDSGYRYVVTAEGKCALYANLERTTEGVILPITTPTPGGGTGVFQSLTEGPNGSNKYFQVSN